MVPTVHIHETEDEICRAAADFLQRKLAETPGLGLGLPTGKTPRGLYRELIERHRAGQADLSRVKTFNIDEYSCREGTDPGFFRRFMREEFFVGDIIKNDALAGRWAVDAAYDYLHPLMQPLLSTACIFMIFGLILTPQVIFDLKFMPETKGPSLEEIEEPLQQQPAGSLR